MDRACGSAAGLRIVPVKHETEKNHDDGSCAKYVVDIDIGEALRLRAQLIVDGGLGHQARVGRTADSLEGICVAADRLLVIRRVGCQVVEQG